MAQEIHLLRLPEIMTRLGIGKTKIYDMIKTGEFPQPMKCGRASLWHARDIEQWTIRGAPRDLPLSDSGKRFELL